MNNFYPGVDIVDIDRIKNSIEKYQDKFLSKVFNKEELDYCNSKSNPFIHFSGKFAAKEAIRKATSTPHNSSKLTFKSIEIFNYVSGKPGVNLNNDSVVDISISHDGNYAVAFCVVQ